MTPPRGQSPQSRAGLPSVPRLLPPDYYSRGQASAACIPADHPSVIPAGCKRESSVFPSPHEPRPAPPSDPPVSLCHSRRPLCHSCSSKRESSVFASPTSQSPSSCLKRESSAVFPPPPHPHPLPEGEREKEVVPTDAVSAGPLSEEEGEGWPRLDWVPALLNSRPGPLDSRSPITNVGDKLCGNDGRVRHGQRPTTNPAPLSPDYYSRGQASAAGIPASLPSVIPAGPLCHSRSSKRESSVFASPTSQSPSSCLKRESSAVFPPPPHPHPLPQGEREKEVVPTDAVSAGPLSEEEGEGWPRLDWVPALLNSRPGPLDSRSPITNVGDKLRGNDGRVRCGQRLTTNPVVSDQ